MLSPGGFEMLTISIITLICVGLTLFLTWRLYILIRIPSKEEHLRARLADITIVRGAYQIKLFNPIVTAKRDWESKIINLFGGNRGVTRVLAHVGETHPPKSFENFMTSPGLPIEGIYKAISNLNLEGVGAESIKDPGNPRIVFIVGSMDPDVCFDKVTKAATEILKGFAV